MPATAEFNTVGTIARTAGADIHRVEYLIRSRGIRPVGRAGNARVFSDKDAERIALQLRTSATSEDATP